MQAKIQNEISAERNTGIKALKEAQKEAEKISDKKMKLLSEHFKGLGIDAKKYEAYNKELSGINDAKVREIKANLTGETRRHLSISAEDIEASSFASALVAGGARVLYPSHASAFTTQEQAESDLAPASAVVYNNSLQKRYNWARGGGSGLFGSGSASNTQWVEFGFWFRPDETRVYSFVPTNVFRDFYIVKADDTWYDSKEARATVDIWIDLNQYNWKGWSVYNVMNVAGDNINANNRLDTNRSNYYSALLGGGDWAFIRVVVQMYVYARGGGSYSELNFAAGTANYLQCPYCIVS